MNRQVTEPAVGEHLWRGAGPRRGSTRGARRRTAPDRVSIRIEPSGGNPCTADLAPTSHEFNVPAGAGTLPLTITLVYAQGESTRTLVLE